MNDADPKSTFRGLPLTPEQDAEVRHYIKKQKQQGAKWDTPELAAMLRDMLEPPGDDDVESDPTFDEIDEIDETKAAAERAAASIDEAMDPIEASEERTAAMEIEAMKGTRH
ncbi:hypothetical protein [Paraburkholderia elongata]|uniref:Uncharacterized protein n=1 Tax=Paraburkholderia elongata TaxID=2675747 RepID=A0A972NTX1_9BURK|nr:hypothetical protein [Paraburkholderia elongata]NPT57797.1 hypothetical protein [Paraburkholderia elongata]